MQVNYWCLGPHSIATWDIRPGRWPAAGRPYAANCLCSAPRPAHRPPDTALREVTGRRVC
jgi:hypothetical protein